MGAVDLTPAMAAALVMAVVDLTPVTEAVALTPVTVAADSTPVMAAVDSTPVMAAVDLTPVMAAVDSTPVMVAVVDPALDQVDMDQAQVADPKDLGAAPVDSAVVVPVTVDTAAGDLIWLTFWEQETKIN